jgi:biotin carboxyl carrier protein
MSCAIGRFGIVLACAVAACRGGSAATSDADDAPKRPATPAAAAPTTGLTLDAGARERAGIETERLGSSAAGQVVSLGGVLIADPGRVSEVEAPVAGRLVLVDGGHWPAFGERVAAGAVIGQVSDAKPLVMDRGGVVTRVGAQPGQIVQAGQMLLEATDFSAPLARVVWRGETAAPATIRVGPVEGTASVPARLVGLAPDADSLTRSPVYLYRVDHGWPGAGPGVAVRATVALDGVSARGLLVPVNAVIQWEGLTWVYRERGGDRFSYERVRVDTRHPVPGGWVIESGDELAAGDTVVVRGAQQLLSEEFKSRATTGDDEDQ